MVASSRLRCVALTAAASALVGGVAIGLNPISAGATPTTDLLSPAPVGSEEFGGQVLVLSNGNYVVVDSLADGAAPDVGAVYLYDGATDSLISTLTGSHSGDQIGADGVTEVGTDNFVILSVSWHNGSSAVGAATWVDGTTGLSGVVGTANSLVGSTKLDFVNSAVTPLPNGNYVVSTPNWDGAAADVGAVTWASGESATTGAVSSANSLVGTSAADAVGSGGVTALRDGSYVVSSPGWDNGTALDVGAVTWASGSGITNVAVSTADSIVGVTDSDMVGFGGVTALTNGNYVVSSPFWSNGATSAAGAVTWAAGNGVTTAAVTTNNSLVGSTSFDLDNSTVTALSNGNYVVSSPFWDGAADSDVGAVTWASGSAATHAAIGVANSVIGSIASDNVGFGGVTALSNGNYVVSSPFWSNTPSSETGASTWADGSQSTAITVEPANSLIGATDFDHVGSGGVTALANGNYVVSSPSWDNASVVDVGAVTWADGNVVTSDVVSTGNSLVGTTPDDGFLRTADSVGSGGVTALTDGNYVVSSPSWNDGGTNGAGAATWATGTTVTSTVVSNGNSLVGASGLDHVGLGGVTVLAGGNYVVSSPDASNGTGAATFGPAGGIAGPISVLNSAFGTPPVNVLSASPGLTAGNEVLVATHQDRVLRFQQTDFQPPVIVPGDVTVHAADAVGPVAVTFPTIATDNVGIFSASCLPESGSLFSIGDTSVTCEATDTATPANTASKTFTVTVLPADVDPPVLSVPSAIHVGTAPGAATRSVPFSVTATDNVGVQSLSCDRLSGSLFPLGITTVTCTATDTSGLVTSNTFTVTVSDVEPPVLGAVPGNVTIEAASGAASQTVTYALPTATDNVGVQGVVCTPSSGSSFPIGLTTVTCTATDVSGLTASQTFTVRVTAGPLPPVTAKDFVSLSGARLADTRPGELTTDSQFAGQGLRAAGSTLELTVTGRGGVASDATAVALNVTAVGALGSGFVTVFPCGSDQPTASSLNFTSGAIVPNAVIAKVGSDGKVCLFVSTATHLVVDVNGYFPPNATLHSVNPARVLETRSGLPTSDGQQQGIGVRSAGSVTAVHIAGRVSVPGDAAAVILNVTVTETQAPGFATVFPCGASIPTASNLNYGTGSTVANLVVSKIGDGGDVCVFTNQGTHLVVDVAGYFPAGTSYQSLIPARLLDTRPTESTVDGKFLGAGLREAGEVTELSVANRGGVPAGAGTVVLNVTVAGSLAPGFVTVYPCGIATPLASNVNYNAGSTVANAVVVKIGSDDKVCLFNSSRTHLVVDVNGYFP